MAVGVARFEAIAVRSVRSPWRLPAVRPHARVRPERMWGTTGTSGR